MPNPDSFLSPLYTTLPPEIQKLFDQRMNAGKIGILLILDQEELIRDLQEEQAPISVIKDTQIATPLQYTIDCDTKPFEPSGLTVAPESDQLPNRVRGQFDSTKVRRLYLSPNQQKGKVIKGTELAKELASEPVLPANIIDFYLANTHLIPEEWKNDENGNFRYIFFWGTIYRGADGRLCVRGLYFADGGWCSHYRSLGYDWGGGSPAAVPAS